MYKSCKSVNELFLQNLHRSGFARCLEAHGQNRTT